VRKRESLISPAKIALLAVVLVALIVRVAALVVDPKPNYLVGLTAWQTEMARNIVDHGRWFVVDRAVLTRLQRRQDEADRLLVPSQIDLSNLEHRGHDEPEILEMPGLAPIVAGVWWVTGNESYSAIRWMQILIDVAMVAVIFWIGVKLTGSSRVGLLAAAGYALWPGAALLAKTPSLDTWTGFFVISALAVFLWARDARHRYPALAVFGLVIGLALYFRPFLIVLAPVLPLAGLRSPLRTRCLEALVPSLVALMIISPWTIRNAYEFGRFIPTRTGLGQALWEGLGQAPNDFGASNSDAATTKLVHRSRPNLRDGTPEFDDYLLHRSISAIEDEPLHYLKLIARRMLYLLPCGLALLWWRRSTRERVLLVAVAFSVILPYVFLRMENRFWVPAMFVYLLLAAIVVECALRVRGSNSAPTVDHP
jgi:4-amino-4-deoxy-L-arabinose transferase-like glycosyltransferase